MDVRHLKKLLQEQFDLASRYTERAIHIILNKDFAPIPTHTGAVFPPSAPTLPYPPKRSDFHWTGISSSLGPLLSPVTEHIDDAIITYHAAEFGRKYYVDSITPLTLSSPHPDVSCLSNLG